MEQRIASSTCLLRPWTTSSFEIEHSLELDGIIADIRHLRWDQIGDAEYVERSHDHLTMALTPNGTRARLIDCSSRGMASTGDIVFIPKGCNVATHNEPSKVSLLCLFFEEQSSQSVLGRNDLSLDLRPCLDVRSQRVRQALARVAEELRHPGFAQTVLIESLAVGIAVDLCRSLAHHGEQDSHIGHMAEWRLRRLKEQIHEGLSERLHVSELAAACGMSERHLIRTFKATVGTTLSDYIAMARISRAKHQLVERQAKIKVVARNCGFQTAAAFSVAFRKATGSTPKEFRNEHLRLAN